MGIELVLGFSLITPFFRRKCLTFDCLSLYNILELISWRKTFMTFRAKYELQDIYFFIVTSLYPLIVGVEGYCYT